MRLSSVCLAALGVLASVSVPGGTLHAVQNSQILTPSPAELRPHPLDCGSSPAQDDRYRALATGALVDGETLSFEQSPALLTPDYSGDLQLKRFLIVGDVGAVVFKRQNPESVTSPIAETWNRVTTTTVAGRLVSVFEPSWPAATYQALFQHRAVGFDNPELLWGMLVVPGQTGVERAVEIRVSFAGIPTSQVVKINDSVQYASNVVNLVMPTFDDPRVGSGPDQADTKNAAKMFFQYFADQYDSVAFIPVASSVLDYGAYHQNVRNAITGLNIPIVDNSKDYGSSSVLQSVEVYAASHYAMNSYSTHEIHHQWGNQIDWPALTGYTFAGHQASVHAPMWSPGASMIGAEITPDRRIVQNGSSYVVAATPTPIVFHPFELYSMGLVGADAVPDLFIFQNQAQFSSNAAVTPAAGTAVQGAGKTVKISDIIAKHGNRSGAIYTTWRRATVVISRAALLSQEEMNYWNFFAQKLNDRNQAGRVSIDGYPSFTAATGNRVLLQSQIKPLAGDTLPETLDIDNPVFAGKDLRDLELTTPFPTTITAGQSYTLTGRVLAKDQDYYQIALLFASYDGSKQVPFYGTVSKSGDFSITFQFTGDQKGVYIVGNLLFWPNAPGQFGRTYLTPITVQ